MPEQILSGETFQNGQQVDAFRLNNHVNNSRLLPGAIAEQLEITGPENLSPSDKFILLDVSEGALRNTSLGNILNTGTSAKIETLTARNITGYSQESIKLVPNQGGFFNHTYSCSGVFVTISCGIGGPALGDVVHITNVIGDQAIVGIYHVTSSTSTTFNIRLNETRAVSLGTVTYRKLGTVFTNGYATVGGTLVALGNAYITGTTTTTGNVNIAGTLRFEGNKAPITIDDVPRVYVKFGTATGAAAAGVENIVYQTPVLTVPSGETWIYEVYVQTTSGHVNGNTRSAYADIKMTVYNNATLLETINGSTAPYGGHVATHTFTKSFTSADVSPRLIVKTQTNYGYNEEPKYMIKLTKVKTSTLSDASSCI
jgi:hypothetical protein